MDRSQGPRGHEQPGWASCYCRGLPRYALQAPSGASSSAATPPAASISTWRAASSLDEYRAEMGEPYVPFTHLGHRRPDRGRRQRRRAYAAAWRIRDVVGYGLADDLYYARNWAAEWAPNRCAGVARPRRVRAGGRSALDDEQREYLRDVSEKLRPEMDERLSRACCIRLPSRTAACPRGRLPSTGSCWQDQRAQGRLLSSPG